METKENGKKCECRHKSLNRTMQYGNSDKNFIERISLREFKSYYVVWKRKNEACKGDGN